MLEKAEEVIKAVASDCEFALARFEEKKCYIRNQVISEFSHHFNQLKGFELSNKKDSMENIQLSVSDTLKIIDKNLKMSSLLAIFGALRAAEMEKKLENAKARYEEIRVRFEEAIVMIDQFQAIEKMAMYFTRQITKFDALFFSLAQDAIATMKKHHYDTSRYNQKEKDQLSVTVSTLFSLSAFLKVSIMDEHQKLNEKAQKALNLMKGQMNALESGQESGHYNVAMIQSKRKGLENL